MADIHLHTPGGETVVQPEVRVAELLRSGELGAPTLFWRSGMADWEPIANFVAAASMAETQPLPTIQTLPGAQPKPETVIASEPSFWAPAKLPRGTESIARPMPAVKPRAAAEGEPAAVRRQAKGRRRFFFRRNPEPLTTMLQVLLVICICIASLELADAIVRYSSVGTDSPVMLDAAGNPLPNASAQDDQISSLSTDGSALVTPEPDSNGDEIGQLLLWAGGGANAFLAVIYFMWLARTDQNCRNFSSIMRFNPEMTVWSYFIPPVCVFRPLQVMQEIWRVSRNPRTWNNDRPSVFVATWWTLALGTVGLAIYGALHSFGLAGHLAQTHAEFFFLLLKAVQITWYAVFLTMITMIIHDQLRLVRESRRHGRDQDDVDEE